MAEHLDFVGISQIKTMRQRQENGGISDAIRAGLVARGLQEELLSGETRYSLGGHLRDGRPFTVGFNEQSGSLQVNISDSRQGADFFPGYEINEDVSHALTQFDSKCSDCTDDYDRRWSELSRATDVTRWREGGEVTDRSRRLRAFAELDLYERYGDLLQSVMQGMVRTLAL